MTIIIAGKVDVDPKQRDAALQAGIPHVEGALSQKGCVAYAWTADPADPGGIWVYERWDSAEDLAAHLKGPHYVAMRDTIAAHGLRGADVSKFAISQTGAVYDSTGTPRADFFEG